MKSKSSSNHENHTVVINRRRFVFAKKAGEELKQGRLPKERFKKKWWRWPENELTGKVPWFVFAWRMLWMPLIIIGLLVMVLGMLCAYGNRHAVRVWKDVFG